MKTTLSRLAVLLVAAATLAGCAVYVGPPRHYGPGPCYYDHYGYYHCR